MPQLMFAVFAQRVSVDRFNNMMDIHNVLEELSLPAPSPDRLKTVQKTKKGALAFPFGFQLLIHWRRSEPSKPEGTVNSRVVLIGPDGRKLGISEQVVNLRPSQYMRGLINYRQLLVVGAGTYTANIQLQSGKRWRKVGEASFSVNFKAAVSAPGQSPGAPRVH
jgi:hypothetical protein